MERKGMERKEITQAHKVRSDKYHEEFTRFMLKFYANKDAKKADREAFIEQHAENYPQLKNPVVHFRLAARKYFDEKVYSFRGVNTDTPEKPSYCPDKWP